MDVSTIYFDDNRSNRNNTWGVL